MAVQLEFINFIAPIETINEKYPGGWEQRLKDHQNLIGGRVWFDDYLFRDGAMNPMDIGSLVEEWKSLVSIPMMAEKIQVSGLMYVLSKQCLAVQHYLAIG